jgi:peptidoglycan DL-endopeptidase CwlO
MIGDFVTAGTWWHGEMTDCNAASAGVNFHMIGILFSLILVGAVVARGQLPEPQKAKSGYGRPALIETAQLIEFDTLPEDRRKLIEAAIAVARDSPWLPYRFGGSAPTDGGFDCSGAMYFVMRKAGLKPPRTSAEQFLWLNENARLTGIAPSVKSLDHPEMKNLLPGDLLFWGGTYVPADGGKVNITHVALFLGHEKKDHRAVMINATDGRSYRGTKANGYGVYDFQLPREGSKAVFMGYGTPPGIAQVK